MPMHTDYIVGGSRLPRNVPTHGPTKKALTNLMSCGCLRNWEEFTHLSKRGKSYELDCIRLRLCISEQCWRPGDVNNISLTTSDKCVPYPNIVHRTLTNKLKNTKDLKRDTFALISEKRRLLEARHRCCHERYGRDLNTAFKFTKAEIKKFGDSRELEVRNEVKGLIRNSVWQNMVSPSKVRNLTTGQVSDVELEALSLGGDFNLQLGKSSLLDIAAAFHGYDYRYRNDGCKPDLDRVKTELISSISKDNRKVLPRRYNDAVKSIKANRDIMVVKSDKGKETVICYRTTYLALVNSHFGNTNTYQPVDNSDIAGSDLDCMTSNLRSDLKCFVDRAPDEHHKKLIKGLYPPANPRFPTARCSLKTHKSGITETFIPVRPLISNIDSPTSIMASYLGSRLTNLLGVVSDRHLKSTEDFSNFVKNCTSNGRLLSLDVESLFTAIPKNRIMDFLRNQSNGWGDNPPSHAEPVNPPLYNFDIDSKIFCDLVELCLKYNQFQIEGCFFRQIEGLFMGSSISPPLAQLFMEYFESELYDKLIPDNIKPVEMKRYVDDCFVIYDKSDEDFIKFFELLNKLDQHINFTYEMSKPGVDIGLPDEVLEVLPFLDLKVIRYLDCDSNTISNKLSIHRKDSHSGSYIHFLSSQPTSTKKAVIRNMFLRAYRYCDNLFLEAEEGKIYEDFGKLGYCRSFITKAKISAKVGRDRELRIRAGSELPRPPRERSKYHIGLPFHDKGSRLGYSLRCRGVDLTFSSRNSLLRHITYRETTHTDSGVYILGCMPPDCERVYIGQSKHIPTRLKQHDDANRLRNYKYTSARHSRLVGHKMDTTSEFALYRSNSLSHRLIVETCLIAACHTIRGNTRSYTVRDHDKIAPMILRGAPLDWELIARFQPTKFNREAIPRKHRKLFQHPGRLPANPVDNFPVPVVQSSPALQMSPRVTEAPQVSSHSYPLRSIGPIDEATLFLH